MSEGTQGRLIGACVAVLFWTAVAWQVGYV